MHRPAWSLLLLALVAQGMGTGHAGEALDRQQRYIKRIQGVAKSIRSRGETFLARRQNRDGSFGTDPAQRPGITGAVLYAFATRDEPYTEHAGPFVSEAVAYLLSRQGADGGFGSPFNTAYALKGLEALAAAAPDAESKGRYAAVIARARAAGQNAAAEEASATGRFGAMLRQSILPNLAAARMLVDGKDWMARATHQLYQAQARDPKEGAAYGSFRDPDPEALEHDPVLATAFAVIIADRVYVHYGAFR